MTAHFDEFEEEMTSRSLERAYDYVDEHRIGGLEEVSAGLFHAEVHGSELYDVDIRLRGNDIVFASCTCPYDYDGYCKHIGAVLLTLRDYKHGGNHQQNVTYDAMIAKHRDCESGNRERHGTIDARKRRGSRHGISHAATSRQGLRLEIRMGRCRHKRRDGRIRGSRTIERLSAGHETHVRGFAKNSVVRETSR